MRNRWGTGVALLGMAWVVSQSAYGADDPNVPKVTPKADDQKTSTVKENGKSSDPISFVGVMVEELHPAFAKHLPGAGARGQGLMVEEVGADSPAGKAGIKTHDILMTYNDQKLFTPEQFIKLIHSDKPGTAVSFGLIREGKSQTVKVTLGERDAHWHHPHFANQFPQHHHMGWGRPAHLNWHHPAQQTQSDGDHPAWKSFDSLTLKKLDKDRFHASVSYTDKDGKMQKHEYEGTRDEIRKKIEDDKNLMPNERFHLERGLDLQDGNAPFFLPPEEQFFDF